jgi:hypothetical protein
MVEVNIAAYGNALKTATNTTPSGLYDTEPKAKMGTGDGLRQYYRWGMYSECLSSILACLGRVIQRPRLGDR